jgi:hypothetical protein
VTTVDTHVIISSKTTTITAGLLEITQGLSPLLLL